MFEHDTARGARSPGPTAAPEDLRSHDDGEAASSGSGHAIPAALRRKMEPVLGYDLSAVRIHHGAQAGALNARAYAQGANIYMAPGCYDPASQTGQELLGHELAHIVQQAQGGVAATKRVGGVDVNGDAALERDADALGARAARGDGAAASGRGPKLLPCIAAAVGTGRVAQRLIDDDDVEILEQLEKSLHAYQTTESTKVAGQLVYGQKPIDLGTFDNAPMEELGKYSKFANSKDSKKHHDAEVKLLDVAHIALNKLLVAKGKLKPAVLHMRGNRGTCDRCRGAIERFQLDYPSVEVKIYYQQTTRVAGSQIENTKGKGTYSNGYDSAVPASSQYRGEKSCPESLRPETTLWYKELQSKNDIASGVDPVDELRDQYQRKLVETRRTEFIEKIRDRQDKLFARDLSLLRVTRICRLAPKPQVAPAKKQAAPQNDWLIGTNTLPKSKPQAPPPMNTLKRAGLDHDDWLTAISDQLGVQWKHEKPSSWQGTIQYPNRASYDIHHDQVDAALQGQTSSKFKPPAWDAVRCDESPLHAGLARVVDEVNRGVHDQMLSRILHFDLSYVPPLVQ